MKCIRTLAACTLALGAWQAPASAGQDAYVGEIMMIGGSYCPRGTVLADGRLLAIGDFPALFSLFGTMYGGNGQTSFGVPDLRSRVPVGIGAGAGLMTVTQGQMAGSETTVLTQGQLPMHSHSAVSQASSALNATTETTDTTSPNGSRLGELPGGSAYASSGAFDAALEDGSVTTTVTTTIGSTGGSQPVSLVQPYLGMRYCVAVTGIYPPRD